MEELVEEVMVEEEVKEVEVFEEVWVVLAGFDAFAHHWDEVFEVLEGDEFEEGGVDVFEVQFMDAPEFEAD